MTNSDIAALSNQAIESEIATLSAQIDVAEHRLLTLVRELDARQRHRDHGLASMAIWLNWRVGLGLVAAREKVRVAKALGGLSRIDAAFAKAEVSYSKVRAMTRIATPENEGRLLNMAKSASAAQLERICRGVEQVTTRGAEGQKRWVRVLPCTDGMVRLEARMHPDEAALVLKALDAAVEEDSAEAPPAEKRKSRPDGLIRVADAFLAGQRPDGRPGGERHQLIVCVREDPLAPGGVSAEAEGAGLVTPVTLNRLACDASVTRVAVDDQATPRDVGRKTRTIPPAIRRALTARDGGCRFPGCTNRRWVDAHHISHFVDGGETSRDNLILLCTAHHRLVHEGGFRVSGDATGPRFERPDGSLITPPPIDVTPGTWLPAAAPPRAPPMLPPDYNLAIGIAMSRAA
jgi:hypothetical protein